MSIVVIEGFENSRVGDGVTINAGYVTSFMTGRAGTGSLALRLHNTSGSPQGICSAFFATPSAVGQLGVAIQFNNSWSAGYQFLRLQEGATVHVAARTNATTGFLEIVRGDGTVLATSSVPVPNTNGGWNHFILAATIADSGGSAALYMNGSLVCQVTGADTRNAGTTGLLDRGVAQSNVFGASTGATNVYFDDIYLADDMTPRGDCKVQRLIPNGTGDSAEWVPTGSASGWAAVDGDNSMTDYVAATGAAKDLYALSDLPASATSVVAVQAEALVQKSDTGVAPGTVSAVAKSVGGVEQQSPLAVPAVISTTAAWFKAPIRELDPNGDPWTPARVNGMQLGLVNVP